MTRGVRLEDLPAAVRARIANSAISTIPSAKPKKNRSVAKGHTTWRCHACKHTTSVWAQAERHAHGKGHVRIEIVL